MSINLTYQGMTDQELHAARDVERAKIAVAQRKVEWITKELSRRSPTASDHKHVLDGFSECGWPPHSWRR